MSDGGRLRRQSQMQQMVGDLGRARVDPIRNGREVGLSYRVVCRTCAIGAVPWSTWQNGRPTSERNSYRACVDRWAEHVDRRHARSDDRVTHGNSMP